MKPANRVFRRNNDEDGVEEDWESFAMGGVIDFISVTNLLKLAIARKQYFAGVVNMKSTGRMWGVPTPLSIAGLYTLSCMSTHHRKLASELKSDYYAARCRPGVGIVSEHVRQPDISLDMRPYGL